MRKLSRDSILPCLLIFFLILSLLSPYILPCDPNHTDIANRLQSLSRDHIFGTDAFGRDVFSRTLLGSRASVFSALLIVILSSCLGIFIGMISGFYGGLLDQIIMGICDIFLSFPQMIIAIGVAGLAGSGLKNAVIALILCNWMQYARLARSSTLKEKQSSYVEAIRFSGLSDFQILFKHIFANIKDLMLVTMTINFATMLVSLAGMSFLGIGVQPPKAEWGSMINEGRAYLGEAPWICFFPSLAIILLVSLCNLIARKVAKNKKIQGELK